MPLGFFGGLSRPLLRQSCATAFPSMPLARRTSVSIGARQEWPDSRHRASSSAKVRSRWIGAASSHASRFAALSSSRRISTASDLQYLF
jgi:hypothetical protein